MQLTSAETVKEILTRHNYRVSKSLGQNFLVDASVLATIIETATPEGEDVLEIGPGIGTLTRELAMRARSVTAIEVARRLEPVLRETLAEFSNVELIIGDFLHTDLPKKDYVVVSNLPYSISTPAIFRFLDDEIPWKRMILTVQAEVGDRLAAKPGTKTYGALSISAQAAAVVEVGKRIPPSSFWPQPKIESVIVKFSPRGGERSKALRPLLRKAFSARRKTLRNAIGLEGDSRRPQDVTVEEWIELAKRLS